MLSTVFSVSDDDNDAKVELPLNLIKFSPKLGSIVQYWKTLYSPSRSSIRSSERSFGKKMISSFSLISIFSVDAPFSFI
tara:strand:- start:222 stop:458 length:237 start_codon:yes stop_codon:yes gene_type:complete